jgi:hypothetical protein
MEIQVNVLVVSEMIEWLVKAMCGSSLGGKNVLSFNKYLPCNYWALNIVMEGSGRQTTQGHCPHEHSLLWMYQLVIVD